jgi:hypothetical protein
MPTPPATAQTVTLSAVAAPSPDDVWAVGYTQGPEPSRPFAMHWDGHLWSQPAVPITPGDPADDIQLHGVAATDHGTLWAVGYRIGANTVQPLILRWDGHDWNATAAPPAPPGTRNPELNSVATAPDNGPAWAVGSATDSSTGKLRPLIAAHP